MGNGSFAGQSWKSPQCSSLYKAGVWAADGGEAVSPGQAVSCAMSANSHIVILEAIFKLPGTGIYFAVCVSFVHHSYIMREAGYGLLPSLTDDRTEVCRNQVLAQSHTESRKEIQNSDGCS